MLEVSGAILNAAERDRYNCNVRRPFHVLLRLGWDTSLRGMAFETACTLHLRLPSVPWMVVRDAPGVM